MIRPTSPITARYAADHSRAGPAGPSVSPRSSAMPWYSGVISTKICDRPGVHRQRVERAGEQEHRQRGQGHELEVLPAAHERGGGHAGGREREPDEQDARRRRTPPSGEWIRPMASITIMNATRVQRAAQQRPGDLAERDVARLHRGGQRRVVELVVLQPEEHVEGGVEDRAVHRRGGQQGRGDERGVRDRLAVRAGQVADQAAQADAEGQQVEQRLEEPGREDQPVVPVHPGVPLDQVPAAAPAELAAGQPGDRYHAQRGRGRGPARREPGAPARRCPSWCPTSWCQTYSLRR